MAFAKFEGNRFRIDGEIAENHAILVNLKASIVATSPNGRLFLWLIFVHIYSAISASALTKDVIDA